MTRPIEAILLALICALISAAIGVGIGLARRWHSVQLERALVASQFAPTTS